MQVYPGYLNSAAAKSAAGFSSPVMLADDRRFHAVFLRPQHGLPVFGRPCGRPSRSASANYWSANPHGSALPLSSERADDLIQSWRSSMSHFKTAAIDAAINRFSLSVVDCPLFQISNSTIFVISSRSSIFPS
jgi:hypothetical protein